MAGVFRRQRGDDQPGPKPLKRQRIDDADASVSHNAASSGNAGTSTSVRDDLFSNSNLRNLNVPDSNYPTPEPLPTGPSSIYPASGDLIEPASGSVAGDGPGDGLGSADGRSVGPKRPGRQTLLARIRDATTRLNGLTDNHRPCDCPPICPGPVHRGQAQHRRLGIQPERSQTPSPSESDLTTLDPTPPQGLVDATRDRSRLLAEAEGSRMIDLPRFGPKGIKGRLRMSLQVHDDPYGYRSRLGYYGDIHMTPTSDNRERAVGYISGWRVSKPNARNPYTVPKIWADEWLRGPLPVGDTASITDTNILKDPLRRLYDVDGQPRPNSQYMTANREELGDQGNEIVYIPMIWIYHECQYSPFCELASSL